MEAEDTHTKTSCSPRASSCGEQPCKGCGVCGRALPANHPNGGEAPRAAGVKSYVTAGLRTRATRARISGLALPRRGVVPPSVPLRMRARGRSRGGWRGPRRAMRKRESSQISLRPSQHA
eukprot:scaffold5572_cov390-Prasinococcus_capsulatus_cf.AAC.8